MTQLGRRSFFRSILAAQAAAGAAAAQNPPQPIKPEPPVDFYAQPMRPLRAAGFYGSDAVDSFDKISHQVTFLGVPFDLGTTARPGARYGPRALRAVAGFGGLAQQRRWAGFYDYEEGERYLEGVTMADAGDVTIMPADFMPNFDRITDAIRRILASRSMPVVLGGDHSITFPVLRAFEGTTEKIHIIHFDSHLDFSDGRGAVRYAHGNPMRRSIELGSVSGLSSLGVRGFSSNTQAYEQGQKMGVQVIPALKMLRMGIPQAVASIPKAAQYYISLDVDVIDPSLFTGTGTPVPGGFTYYQMKEILQEVAKKGKIAGFEFVEVAPDYEVFQTSSRMASRLIMDFLAAIFLYQRHHYPASKPVAG